MKKAIINGILIKRYGYIFDLKNPISKPYILGAISIPRFKLNWVPREDIDYCKNLFIQECIRLNNKADAINTSLTSVDESEDDFFSGAFSRNSQPSNETRFTTNQALSYLECKSKDIKSLHDCEIVKAVFLKHNTTVPSSPTPVERLFSEGSKVLTKRRNFI